MFISHKLLLCTGLVVSSMALGQDRSPWLPDPAIARPPGAPDLLAIVIEPAQTEDGSDYARGAIHIIVRNVSNQTVMFDKTTPELQFAAFIDDAEGRKVELTEEARERYFPHPNSVFLVSSSGPMPLAPREETDYTWNLARMFDLSNPGKYRVRLTCNFDTIKQIISSNTIAITISNAADKQ